MKKVLQYSAFCYLCLTFFNVFGQNIDSLKTALKNAKHDTTKISILLQLVENTYDENEWPKYNELANLYAKKLLDSKNIFIIKKAKKGLAETNNNYGIIAENQGKINDALNYYSQSLKYCEEAGDSNNMASILSNIAYLYENQGDIIKSLQLFNKSLLIYESNNNFSGIGTTLNSLGTINLNQGEIETALMLFKKALNTSKKINNQNGIAISLNNIGHIYSLRGYHEMALNCFNQSLEIRQKIGEKIGIAQSFNNIGSMYLKLDNTKQALIYYTKSFNLLKEIGDFHELPQVYENISSIYLANRNYKLAYLYADSSLSLSKKIGLPQNIRNAEELLTTIYYQDKNYKEAFIHYKQYIVLRDSLLNESTRKASIKSQLNYEFEKKEAILKEQQTKERAIASEKSRFQKIIIVSVLLGFLLVLIFAFFIFRTLKLTKHQKHIIEEKQKEILDSIHYAKRIQTSLLPTEKYIERRLKKN